MRLPAGSLRTAKLDTLGISAPGVWQGAYAPKPHPLLRSIRIEFQLALLVVSVIAGLANGIWLASKSGHHGYNFKARMSEAKIGLAASYAAEKSYYSEWAEYAESFSKINYAPEGRRRFYAIGFPTNCVEKEKIPAKKGIIPMQNSTFVGNREQEIMQYFRSVRATHDCVDPKIGFEIYAVGMIQKDGLLDVWKIDQNKNMVHVQDASALATVQEKIESAISALLPFTFILLMFLPFFQCLSIVKHRELANAQDAARAAKTITFLFYAFLVIIFLMMLAAPNY